MRRFEVWRLESPPSATMQVVEVRDSDGARDAAAEYGACEELPDGSRVGVREVLHDGKTEVTEWRVEPVTTYRARPA